MLGTGLVGRVAMDMLTGSLTKHTYDNYGSGMRKFAAFCRGHIAMFVGKAKGDHRNRVSENKTLLQLSIAEFPKLADVLEYYTAYREAYCRQFYGADLPTAFVCICPMEPSASTTRSASTIAFTDIVIDGCTMVGAEHHACF
eukprot:jgi/Tetstr1/439238/TSEL_027680.t1